MKEKIFILNDVLDITDFDSTDLEKIEFDIEYAGKVKELLLMFTVNTAIADSSSGTFGVINSIIARQEDIEDLEQYLTSNSEMAYVIGWVTADAETRFFAKNVGDNYLIDSNFINYALGSYVISHQYLNYYVPSGGKFPIHLNFENLHATNVATDGQVDVLAMIKFEEFC
jgi:hypothetical protein